MVYAVLVEPAVDGGAGNSVVGTEPRDGPFLPRQGDDFHAELRGVLPWHSTLSGRAEVSCIVLSLRGLNQAQSSSIYTLPREPTELSTGKIGTTNHGLRETWSGSHVPSG